MARQLLAGSGWYVASQAVSKAAIVLSSLLIARSVTVSDFGFFVALQALTLLTTAASDLGMYSMLTRELAANRVRLGPMLRRGLVIRLWVFPLWVVAFVVGVLFLRAEGDRAVAALFMGVAGPVMGVSFLLDGGLQGYQRFRASALSLASGQVVFAAGTVVVTAADPPNALGWVGACYLFGEVATLGLRILAIARLPRPRSQINQHENESTSSLRTLRLSAPYALNWILGLAYNRGDVMLVSMLAGAAQAGLYAPASRIQDAMFLLPAAAVAGLIPVTAAAHARGDMISARKGFLLSLIIAIGLSLPATLVIFFTLPSTIPPAFGEDFIGSVGPSKILIWSVPLVAVQAPLLGLLVAVGKVRATSLVYASAFVTSILAHLLLDPKYGAVGGAWASLLREVPTLAMIALIAIRTGLIKQLRRRSVSPEEQRSALQEEPRSPIGIEARDPTPGE